MVDWSSAASKGNAVVTSARELFPRELRLRFQPDEVTTASPRETDPREVGLDPRDVEAIWRSVVRYYRLGLHPALSICIRRGGRVVLERTIGHARGNAPDDPEDAPLIPATPDTLFNFFSGSKAVTAMLVHLLHERGLLHVDEPVAAFVPEFARHGKDRITIRDVLAHRAGIALTPGHALDLDGLHDADAILEHLCDLRPEHEPGQQLGYHAVTGGFVLAEVIRRVTGLDAREFLSETVRAPLGFEHFNYGVPEELVEAVAYEAYTGPTPAIPAQLLKRSLGVDMRECVEIANDPRFRTAIVPSGNVIATANEVCRFFELLLREGELDGVRVFQPETVQRAAAPQGAMAIDGVIKIPIRYSMGFMLGNDFWSFYGPRTPKAFGHLGFTNVLGWADPERDISVGLMNNGKPLFSVKFLGWVDIMRTIASRIPRDRR